MAVEVLRINLSLEEVPAPAVKDVGIRHERDLVEGHGHQCIDVCFLVILVNGIRDEIEAFVVGNGSWKQII